MARIKIDYGIDLGTTNSAISKIESGKAIIIKSLDNQKDTTPSCVSFNKKGHVLVGDGGYRNYRSDSLKSLSQNKPLNAFVEFKRTMGTDKTFHSSNIEKDLSSEELSAEILKKLKEYVLDENINAIVITVPAAFKINQIDATRRAAKLAGFDHVEVLMEPVAAAMAYGLNSNKKDGFWFIFDFGGGTFDSALLKVEEGIMRVVDTEGDNYLGGKNLDFAIVDEIIIPHIRENFSIDNILNNDEKKAEYRNALKFISEELKNDLSFNSTKDIYVDPGDFGEDDEGEEVEIEITVSQDQLENVLTPIFQKAIDCSLTLLKRNNINGSSLDAFILVGGPTFSPVLRKMIEKQICKPDTSTDPMTVVSKGAALFASTVDISEEVKEQTRDKTKIQLEIGHESTSVETEEFVTLKILEDKTEGEIPDKVFAEISRGDKAWSSGKVEINVIGEVIDVQLNEGKTNVFNIVLFDDKGNMLESEPGSFNIIQGISGIDTMMGLPHNFGIEIKLKTSGRIAFTSVKGLEKNKSLPATGIKNDLKTQKQIRPGIETDFIKIPLYQGGAEADGTRAIYNDHVYDAIISGNDLPALLPENSTVELTIKMDKSQAITIHAYFPYLDYTAEIKVRTGDVQSVEKNWLKNEIKKAKGSINELKKDGKNIPDSKLQKVEKDIEKIEKSFENNKNDVDTQQETLANLRKSLKTVDEITAAAEWPKLEEKLKAEFYRLEKADKEFGNDNSNQLVVQLRSQLEEVLQAKDVKLGNVLLEEISILYVKLTFIYQLIGMIQNFNKNFASFRWKNSTKARQLINNGLAKITQKPEAEELRQIVVQLYELLPPEVKKGGDDTILEGQ